MWLYFALYLFLLFEDNEVCCVKKIVIVLLKGFARTRSEQQIVLPSPNCWIETRDNKGKRQMRVQKGIGWQRKATNKGNFQRSPIAKSCTVTYLLQNFSSLVLSCQYTWLSTVDPVPADAVVDGTSVSSNPDRSVLYQVVRVTNYELLKHVVNIRISNDRQRWVSSRTKLSRFIPTQQHWTIAVETIVLTVHLVALWHLDCVCQSGGCTGITYTIHMQNKLRKYAITKTQFAFDNNTVTSWPIYRERERERERESLYVVPSIDDVGVAWLGSQC